MTSSRKIMIEFYSGSGVLAAAFRDRGWHTVTVDLNYAADYNRDVLKLTRKQIIDMCGGEPDFMWFGTPCTGFSVASIGKHWRKTLGGSEPKSETALMSIKLAEKNNEIISWFPDAKFGIENPRGMLRTLPIYSALPRYTVTFCQYGDTRMKPTDIWTNLQSWVCRPICKNGDLCHVRAPRGAKTGTQGLKGAYDRAVYPKQFCEEIAVVASIEVFEEEIK